MLTQMEIEEQKKLFDSWVNSVLMLATAQAWRAWLASYEANKLPGMKPIQPVTKYTYEYED